jgi:hypothetical protein
MVRRWFRDAAARLLNQLDGQVVEERPQGASRNRRRGRRARYTGPSSCCATVACTDSVSEGW